MDASLYHPLFFGFFCLWGAFIALRYRASQGQTLITTIESSRWGWFISFIWEVSDMQIYFVYSIFYLLSRVVALVVLAYLIKLLIARLKRN